MAAGWRIRRGGCPQASDLPRGGPAGTLARAVARAPRAVGPVVVGGPRRTQAEVRAALAGELGRSLLRVDGADLDRRLASAYDVVSVSFDRAFPHTLRVRIRAERPVLLLRRGAEGWVVSARGRVLSRVRNTRLSSLPRAWVPASTEVGVGE